MSDTSWAYGDLRPKKGCWAPGSYMNRCSRCGESFTGDKRAAICSDCAYGPCPKVGSQWTHLKSGQDYVVTGLCLIEADLTMGVLYRAETVSGKYADSTKNPQWCRPASEFLDGRFQRKASQ